MLVSWLGHSCFKVEKDGYTVVFDPYASGYVPGLRDVNESANMVLSSHGHNDHNALEEVQILESKGEAPKVTAIEVCHDDQGGRLRGMSKIHIVDFGDEKIVHMGDIGCALTKEQENALWGADVLLIPIGGFYTIETDEAIAMIRALEPKIVVPMHFRDDEAGFGYDVIDTVDGYESKINRKIKKGISEFDTAKVEAGSTIIMRPLRVGGEK